MLLFPRRIKISLNLFNIGVISLAFLFDEIKFKSLLIKLRFLFALEGDLYSDIFLISLSLNSLLSFNVVVVS